MAGKCATGPSVPPGIWLIYESVEECCAVNHPESRVCDPNKEASNNEEDAFEVIPIQFTIQRLPHLDSDIDVQEVRDEMFVVLEKALSNIEDRIEGLMIESVQENVELTNLASNDADAQPAKNDAATSTEEVVLYYDVTVVTDKAQPEYNGFIIIENILEAYGNVVDEEKGDYVYLGYIMLKYFANGVNLLWCTNRTAAGDTFDMCNETDETITVKFRLSNIPQRLDVELLIQEMIDIYQDVILLEEQLDGSSGTSSAMLVDLDITGIEYKLIDLPLSYNTANDDDIAKDVVLNIKLARSNKLLGKNDIIGTAINEKLQRFKGTLILNRIQDYTDNKSMDLELNWCIDDDGEYNAECPNTTLGGAKASESTPTVQWFALSNYWVIITITALCVITTCCFVKCIAALVTQREESKTEQNMMNYIYTGQNHSKPPRPWRNSRKTSKKAAVVEPPQRRRRHGNQQQQQAQRQRHRSRRQTSAHKPRKGPHQPRKHREMKMLANAPYDSNDQQLLLKQKQK